jgi:hypothetical protein
MADYTLRYSVPRALAKLVEVQITADRYRFRLRSVNCGGQVAPPLLQTSTPRHRCKSLEYTQRAITLPIQNVTVGVAGKTQSQAVFKEL